MSPCYKRGLAKNVRWYFRIRHLGFNFTSKAIYLTRKEAQVAEREKLKELEEELRRPKSAMMLKTLMEKRLDYLQGQKSNDYYKENKRYYKKLLHKVGDIQANQVRKEAIHELMMFESNRLKKMGCTNHKANSMLRSLKALFNWGNKIFDLDVRNPANLDFIKIEKNAKYIPTDKEILDVRKTLTKEQKLLFDFVEESGCRIGEALRFTAKDIKGNYIVLYTRKAKNSDLTPRVIPLPSCIAGIKFTDRLFSHWTAYPRFLEDRTVNWSWHGLRHRRASIWANNGMSVFDIMHLLGHQNVQTTMGYLQKLGIYLLNGDNLATENSPEGRK
jgi:integrase